MQTPITRQRRDSTLVLAALLLAAPAACGDDTVSGTGGGGGAGPGATTSTASSTSTVATSSASTASAGGGDPGSGGAGGGGTGGGTGGAGATCLPADVLEVLQTHLDDMSASAQYLAGHAGAQEATALLLAPGMPNPPGISGLYATLIGPCTDGEPSEYDPYCDQGTCSQIGCTGEGAGWTMTTWLDEPYEGEGFSITSVEIVNTWTEGDPGTTITIAVEATGPEDRDWSFVGTGALDEDGVSLAYAFDAWVAGRAAAMDWSVTTEGTIGEITAGDVVVATIGGADEHFELTGACPR
jgi:hypothetical protein